VPEAKVSWPLLLLAAQETLAADDALTAALVAGDYQHAPEICLLMMLVRPYEWKRLMNAYMAFHQAASEVLNRTAGSA
jgi:hypothetical protein